MGSAKLLPGALSSPDQRPRSPIRVHRLRQNAIATATGSRAQDVGFQAQCRLKGIDRVHRDRIPGQGLWHLRSPNAKDRGHTHLWFGDTLGSGLLDPRLRQDGRRRCVGQESLGACRTPVEIRAFLEMPSEQRQKKSSQPCRNPSLSFVAIMKVEQAPRPPQLRRK